MRPPHTPFLLALLLALSQPSPTTAQETAPAPDPTDTLAEAQARYAAGADHYARGDYPAALLEFDRSYQLVPSLRVLFARALCRHALADLPGAAQDLRRYLAEGGDAVPPDLRRQADTLLAEISPNLGRLAVELAEPDADLFLDGRLVGTSPLPDDLETTAGRHLLEIRKDGFTPARLELSVRGGERTVANVTLVPRPAVLRVLTGDAPAAVLVDGRPAGTAGDEIELPPGSHRVRIEAPGFDPIERDVELHPGSAESLAVVLVPVPPPTPAPEPAAGQPGLGERYWWLWTTLGAAALAGAVAAGILLWPDDAPAADWSWRMR